MCIHNKNDLDILSRTLYGEARGDYKQPTGGLSALVAVANVVMNRTRFPNRYGRSIQEVCLKPWQFSCWNEKDPNRAKIQDPSLHDPLFQICRTVSESVSTGQWPDLTKGSNHYYSTTLPQPPYWAQGQCPRMHIGNHLFFALDI